MIVAAVAMTVIEPLYVACGFTLYLQRRTALEGWDIELRFRQLASRIEGLARAAGTPGLVAALVLAASLAIAPVIDARAAEPERAGKEIREILKDPEFGHEEQRWHLAYVGPNMPRQSEDEADQLGMAGEDAGPGGEGRTHRRPGPHSRSTRPSFSTISRSTCAFTQSPGRARRAPIPIRHRRASRVASR